MSSAAPLVEETEDRLRRELAQSSQAQARESLLREECARLRADNRALKPERRLLVGASEAPQTRERQHDERRRTSMTRRRSEPPPQ